MPRQKLLCAEMKKEQIKKESLLSKEKLKLGGGCKRIKYKK